MGATTGAQPGDDPERADAPSGIRRVLGHAGRIAGGIVGAACLVVLLALVAAVPLLHVAALGVLLEASGRVARSGRLRDGFPLIGQAPRWVTLAAGVWAVLVPVRFLAGAAGDARILAPGSPADVGLHRAVGLAALLAILHLDAALAHGGRIRDFLRPLRNLLWQLARLRGRAPASPALVPAPVATVPATPGPDRSPVHYVSLGLRGFLGSLAWLVPPTVLFAAAQDPEGPAAPVSVAGAVVLMAVLAWLPFLQARFAAENRLRALFEVGRIRRLFPRAPLACWLAVFTTLGLSLPLAFFKIVVPPRDAVWMITPAFILALYPGKLLAGWATHRASSRELPAWWPVRLLGRLLLGATLLIHLYVLFLTQLVGEHGRGTLFEHQAFLLRIGF